MRVQSACSLALFAFLCASSVPCQSTASPHESPYGSVDPLIGTAGGGNTFPGATLPFGMIQWSPDTNQDAWYRYDEKQLHGFSLTHVSGAGCPLYGDFAVLPTLDDLTASPGTKFVPVPLDRKDEKAQPGYYAVTLNNGVRVELTVTERAGIARFIFPAGKPARLLVNAGSSTESIPGGSHDYNHDWIALKGTDGFTGFSGAGHFCQSSSHYTIYVAGQFSKPIVKTAAWQDDAMAADGKTAEGRRTGVWLDFGNLREVMLKVGISFVGADGAKNNLAKEIPGWDFDATRARAMTTWTDLLNRIEVEGGTEDQRKIFYTGVYHSFLSPNVFSDEDGQYIGFDGKIRSVGSKQKAQYANFSDWDIYRNTVQWQALFEPERVSDMMQSLVNDAEQSGWFPRWPAANDVTYVMGGDSPVALLSSAYAFGARDLDAEKALEYMVKAGTEPGKGPHKGEERPFLAEYLKLGYTPVDKDRIAASRTLEYASDDFAIAQFAKALGRQDVYGQFLKRSENWRTLLDPQTHWIRPRNSDGSWLADFDPETSMPKRYENAGTPSDQMGFEEGNTWQYSFMVPFDYPALFEAMGGERVVEPRLDRFFTALRCWGKPCFNIENEPDFVTPYAYVFLGKPWKTEEVVTRIGKETFKPTPDGIPGNDDLGATSGVYVWNALGFYPGVPGVGGLVLGIPMFDRATLKLAGNRTVVVSRQGPGNYVHGLTFNGTPYASTWLPISKLQTGVTQMQFTMGTEPNTKRGIAIEDRPPTFR